MYHKLTVSETSSYLMQWMLLVVAEYFEHYGLCLDVLHEGFRHGHSDLAVKRGS